MVTDGNPTLNNTTNTSASEVNWEDFTQAVTSANLLKSNDSRVITVAAGAAGSISIPGLVGISGPLTNQPSALDDDYIIGTPAELADALRDLALARCGASLDIEKQSVGGTATFDFTGTGAGLPATFTRDTAAANPTANAPFAFTAPQFGTKYVQETPEAGWTLTNIACTANGAVITIGTGSGAGFAQGATAGFDPGDTTVRAVIDASDAPACTFTNAQASLDIEKQSVGGTGTFNYAVNGTGLAPFTRNTAVANPTTNAPFTFTAPQFGTKDVQETPVPAGWTLTNIVCAANGAVITIGTGIGAGFASPGGAGFNAGDTTVRAVIAAGNTPTCTFTNTADASLDVEKQSVGGTATFDFGGTGAGLPATFTRDTAVANPTANAPFTFTAAQFGTKDVVETPEAGWTLSNIVCAANGAVITIGTGSGAGFAQGATAGFDPGDTTVRAVIAAGNTPTCTFTNSLNASLDIEKQSVGGTATFDYAVNGAGLAPFTRNTAVSNPTANAPFTFAAAQFGTKDVQETPVPAGWTLTNIVCAANGAVMTIGTGIGGTFAQGATAGFDPGDTTVRAAIDAGDTPTCTFTNSRDASLDIEKQSVGGTATFDFTGTGAGLPATFTRDTAAANPTANAPFTFTAAQFGTKDVVETPEAGWTLTNIACTANGAVITIGTGSGAGFAQGATAGFDPGDTTVRAVLAAGNTPTCTYTNTADATITVTKDAVPDSAQLFAFTTTGTGGGTTFQSGSFILDDDPASGTPNTLTFTFVGAAATGTKTIQETLPVPGWDLTSLVCSKGTTNVATGLASIALLPGDAVTCTYTNTQNASLDIEKQSVGGTATFDFAVNGSGLAPFTRNTAVANPTANAPFALTGFQLGTKDVQETPEPGWTLTNIVCAANGAVITIGTGIGGTFAQGATAGFDPGDTTVRAVITGGDAPTCTYTNTQNASLSISKTTEGGDGTFDFTGTGTGVPAAFTIATTGGTGAYAGNPIAFVPTPVRHQDGDRDRARRLDAHEHRLHR